MGNILPESFYHSQSVVHISKQLLGKTLVSNINGIICKGKIVETEAYRAPDDKACHAYQNRRTPRTETMFAKGGTAYVYICYGIHHLFNVVTGPEGMAHAVLIRAVEPISGIEKMLERRKFNDLKHELTNGPGKFTIAMGIHRNHDGSSLLDEGSGIWIEDTVIALDEKDIISGPRVGMSTAEECSHWPWRFRINGNPWSSKPNMVSYPQIPS